MHTIEQAKEAAQKGFNVESLIDGREGHVTFVFYQPSTPETAVRVHIPFTQLESFIEEMKDVKNPELTTVISRVDKGFVNDKVKLSQLADCLGTCKEDLTAVSMKDVSTMTDELHLFDKTGKRVAKIEVPFNKDNPLTNTFRLSGK